MAGRRRAVELAMTGEEIETLTALRGRGPGGAPRGAGANTARLSPAAVVFCCGTKLGYIIRRSSAASSGHWRMARWRPSTTDRDRARSRRSRRKPKPGWYLGVRQGQGARLSARAVDDAAFGPSCASADRRQGTNVSPIWSRARCARSSAKRTSSRTRCATTWNSATPSSSRRWRRFCQHRDQVDPRQSLRTHRSRKPEPGSTTTPGRPLPNLNVHAQKKKGARPWAPSSSRASFPSLPVLFCVTSAWHQNTNHQGTHHGLGINDVNRHPVIHTCLKGRRIL